MKDPDEDETVLWSAIFVSPSDSGGEILEFTKSEG